MGPVPQGAWERGSACASSAPSPSGEAGARRRSVSPAPGRDVRPPPGREQPRFRRLVGCGCRRGTVSPQAPVGCGRPQGHVVPPTPTQAPRAVEGLRATPARAPVPPARPGPPHLATRRSPSRGRGAGPPGAHVSAGAAGPTRGADADERGWVGPAAPAAARESGSRRPLAWRRPAAVSAGGARTGGPRTCGRGGGGAERGGGAGGRIPGPRAARARGEGQGRAAGAGRLQHPAAERRAGWAVNRFAGKKRRCSHALPRAPALGGTPTFARQPLTGR